MFVVKFFCLICVQINLWKFVGSSSRKSPVVIIPGTGGNRLEAKLIDKKHKPAWYCLTSTITYYTIWFDLSSPLLTKCWVDNIRLEWDMKRQEIHNVQGVITRVTDFGSTDTMECLDPMCLVPYMKPLVEYLESIGYEKDQDLRGAPYDFRFSPDKMPAGYFELLKELIEETYNQNGKQQVTLLSHSYGGLMVLYFLNHMTTEWKNNFIKQWIPMAAPFGGTILETLVFSSGFVHQELKHLVKPLDVRIAQRTYTSNLVLLPSAKAWPGDYIFAMTKDTNFTVSDMGRFLDAVGFNEGRIMMSHVINSTALLSTVPGVPIYCFYGNKANSTINRFIFDKDDRFPNQPSSFQYGPGDDTVNLESLVLCKSFEDQQKEDVVVEELPGVGHLDILSNQEMFTALDVLLVVAP